MVSEIGFGCARLGGVLEGDSKPDLLRTLHSAFDAGITFFDTADMYTGGESERLIGEAFRGRRDRVVIASKAGYRLPAQKKAVAKIKPLLRPIVRRAGITRGSLPRSVTGSPSQEFSASYLVKAVEGSLRRLQTDYLDLYQLHSPPASVIEHGEFLAPLEKLKAQGKVRYFGVSCETTQDAILCLRHPEISSLQVRVSMLEQSVVPEVVPQASERGIALVARECFAGGMLAKHPEIAQRDNVEVGSGERAWPEHYLNLAETWSRPVAHLALDFVLGLEGISVVLLGMRTEQQLTDNLRYAAAPRLSREQYDVLKDKVGVRNTSRA